jgi:hypothetical protein
VYIEAQPCRVTMALPTEKTGMIVEPVTPFVENFLDKVSENDK